MTRYINNFYYPFSSRFIGTVTSKEDSPVDKRGYATHTLDFGDPTNPFNVGVYECYLCNTKTTSRKKWWFWGRKVTKVEKNWVVCEKK